MTIDADISSYLAIQPKAKCRDLETLHALIRGLIPDGRLWFLDGKDEQGRTVSNPNIGYGVQQMRYTDGRTREFYQIFHVRSRVCRVSFPDPAGT